MRCERNGQTGAWSDWQSLDLDDLVAPSGLSAVVNNTSVLLSWTNGETTYPVEVLARLDTDTTLQSVAVLPAGSTSYTLLLTQPSTTYLLGVRYLDPKGCTSATTTIGADTDIPICLDPPINLAAFADGAGTYGVECTAIAVPGGVEVWVATETAVDAGVAGTYTEVDTVVALLDPLRTRWTVTTPTPNDGLLRFIKLQSAAPGYTSCGFSDPVTIDPWTLVAPGDPVPDPDPVTVPGLVSVPIPIPLVRPGQSGLVVYQIDADRAVIPIVGRTAQSRAPLTGVTSAWIEAVIVASTLPANAYLAVEFENPAVPGDWHSLESDTPGAEGPTLALDPTSLDALDGNTDEDAWVVTGPAIAVRDEAADLVRLRPVIAGGDTSGGIIIGALVLWVVVGSPANVPEDIPDIPTEDPGSCDAPGDLVTTYASQAAAFAAEPTD
jgi:hypothetical protein